jgi:hypothetical protein
MAAALVLPISGPYLGSWNAFPFGTQNDDGYQLSCTLQGQELNETDAYGLTLVEGIWRGQNWRARLRGVEWNKTGLLGALQMFGTTAGTVPPIPATTTLIPVLTNIGDRWSKYCQAMLLTAILGNPPTTPQTLTAVLAGVAPNSTSEMMFTSKVREMPLEFVFLPYATTIASVTFNLPFTTT